jgi:hypothetical protein
MNKKVTISRHSRRQFIQYGALAAGGAFLAGPYLLRGQNLNSRLNIAQIGLGVKGMTDAQCCFSAENLFAVCDVNSNLTDGLKNQLPSVKTYKDYRELFDKEKSIDAVDIAVPDHSHAIIAATAMKLGKHVYCQKPLTHDVYEARLLRDLARQSKVATQMGNQGSASDGLRRAVELVQAGLIGPVHKAYVWTNRPIWPQGLDRPAGSDPVPSNFDWDLWLGTAPARPFKEKWPDAQVAEKAQALHLDSNTYQAQFLRFTPNVYHPFNWRGWYDYGTGPLGDMGCHTVNWPFRALKLGYPTEIEASSTGMKKEMFGDSSRIRFEFPAREGMPPVTFLWLDGGNMPPPELTADFAAMYGRVSPSGCIMVGDKGMVLSPDDGDGEFHVFVKLKDDKELVIAPRHPAAAAIPQTIPRNAFDNKEQADLRHHLEWFAACKSGKHDTAYSNFEIAAYLTEIILLGCVAMRSGQKLEWDGPGMKAKNASAAAQFIKRDYRAGWKI